MFLHFILTAPQRVFGVQWNPDTTICQRSSKITSASVDNTLLDLQNSSYRTQPHSIIAKYCYIGVNLSELNDMEDKVDKKA